MANYICRAANPKIPDYLVVKVSIPAGTTVTAGSIVPISLLDATIPDNYQVFTGTQPAAANLGVRMALLINDGFETLSDGRRPDGQPDYTQYQYTAGQVVTGILLVTGLVFEISKDAITNGNAVAVGDFIEPVNGSYKTIRVASATGRTANVKSALRVLNANKNFRLGGNMGANLASTVVAIVTD